MNQGDFFFRYLQTVSKELRDPNFVVCKYSDNKGFCILFHLVPDNGQPALTFDYLPFLNRILTPTLRAEEGLTEATVGKTETSAQS